VAESKKTPRFDFTTFGETMLRISISPGTPLETAAGAALYAAGSESNVAAALASLGYRTAWCSRLPDTPPGRLVANQIRQAGVDMSLVQWSPTGRVGTMYVELESPPTPVRVTYDRAGSCATEMTVDSIPWDELLSTRLLHLTGITPALSPHCMAVTKEAIARAAAADVPVSFDVNFRAKLWSAKQARDTLLPLLKSVTLLFIGESDATEVLGLTGSPEEKLKSLAKLTSAQQIVLTVGSEGTIAWDDGTITRQPAEPTTVIDRLGAGDALAAGVIHGWLDNDFITGLRAGAALAALALRRHGDIVIARRDELKSLMGARSNRPQR